MSTNNAESRDEAMRALLAPKVTAGATEGEMAAALNAGGFRNKGGREWNWASFICGQTLCHF